MSRSERVGLHSMINQQAMGTEDEVDGGGARRLPGPFMPRCAPPRTSPSETRERVRSPSTPPESADVGDGRPPVQSDPPRR